MLVAVTDFGGSDETTEPSDNTVTQWLDQRPLHICVNVFELDSCIDLLVLFCSLDGNPITDVAAKTIIETALANHETINLRHLSLANCELESGQTNQDSLGALVAQGTLKHINLSDNKVRTVMAVCIDLQHRYRQV